MRVKKISADISKDASDMLNDLVVKHERSKGWLLDKMIRKFCEQPEGEPSKGITKKSKAFVPPTTEQVAEYCKERNNAVDPQHFVDHYIANGWMRGKVKIRDWKACVRTWEKSKQEEKVTVSVLNDTDWAKNINEVL